MGEQSSICCAPGSAQHEFVDHTCTKNAEKPFSRAETHFVRRLLFQTIHDIALMIDQERRGREASPTGGMLDSQSVKALGAPQAAQFGGLRVDSAEDGSHLAVVAVVSIGAIASCGHRFLLSPLSCSPSHHAVFRLVEKRARAVAAL
jgi:hypothetical protein